MSDHPADRHHRASEIFLRAAELSGDARAQWLEEQCGSDAALRAEVEGLLAHDAGDDSFLGASPMANVAASFAATLSSDRATLPTRIGRYRILDVLGEGGMGVVYRAEQDQPKRPVALKVLRGGMITPPILRRFEREAQTLGRLHHRGIAQIYDAGTFDSGNGVQPYFAMELIEGMPLTEFIARRQPDMPMLVAILVRICEAVEHAHRRGVVHRDLKPGNIIVVEPEAHGGTGSDSDSGRFAGDGPQPVILDFGIARITDSDRQTTTIQTDVGQLLGTLPYMSPEQVSGESGAIDARSDVYALGIIAYEMFAGRPPLELRDKLLHEAVRIIREDDPPPISTINRTYRGDLQTILSKAMEKERSRRYPSAAALADDLQRFMRNEPISARRPSAIYQLTKFARRHRLLVTAAAAIFLVLIAGIVGTSVGLARAMASAALAGEREQEAIRAGDAEREQRELAEQRERDLQRVGEFQARLLYGLNPFELGEEILADLRDQLQSSGVHDDETNDSASDDLDQLNRLLDRINATNLGRRIIDQTMLVRASQAIEQEFSEDPEIEASLRQTVAGVYFGLGLYERGAPHLHRAFEIWRDLYGENDHRTLHIMRFVSLILEKAGELAEAEAVARDLVERAEHALEPTDPEWFEALNRLAIALDAQNRIEEAETYYRRALEGRIAAFGESHPDTLTSIHNFAGVLGDLGRSEEASIWFERALTGRTQAFGEDDPATLSTIDQYAVFLRNQGRLDEAEPLARRAYESRRRILGDAHPLTTFSLNVVGNILLAQERLSEAEAVLRSVHAQRQTIHGDGHPETLNTVHNLAALLRRAGRLDELQTLLQDAVPLALEVFPASHPARWRFLQELALLHEAMEHDADAQDTWQRTLQAAAEAHGDDHVRTLRVHLRIAAHLSRCGDHDPALAHARLAVDGLRSAFGADHDEARQASDLLAEVEAAAAQAGTDR